MKIKIIGVNNTRRKELENKVRKAVNKLSVAADIQVISVLDDILKYDVTGIPAVLIDEVIVCQKCVPDDFWDVTFEVHRRIKAAFSENDVKVAYSEGVELGPIGA